MRDKKVVAEVLAAHADHLIGDKTNGENYLSLFPDYRAELAPLLRIAERVKGVLVPVTSSPAFEAGLKQDLLAAAMQRTEERAAEKPVPFLHRRWVLIGAAAIGSALSVVGIVVALLWRQRSIAGA